MFDLAVNCEVASWGGFGTSPDGTGSGHEATIAFHDVNILFRQRNLDSNRRGIVRPMSNDMIRSAARNQTAGFATSEQSDRGSHTNKLGNNSQIGRASCRERV